MSMKTSREERTFTVTGGWRRRADSPNWPGWTSGTTVQSMKWTNSVLYSPNIVGWKGLIAAGIGVSTSMDGVRGSYRQGHGTATTNWYTHQTQNGSYESYASGALHQQSLYNPYALPSGGLTSPVNEARSRAQIDFTKHFRKKTQTFSSGIFMGELGEAVRMLASPAKAVREGITTLWKDAKRIHRGRGVTSKSIRAYQDAIAGAWLEWVYGVKPSIHDLDDACRSFRQMAQGRTFDIIRINGFGGSVVASEGFETFSPGTPGFSANANWRCSSTVKKLVTVDIKGAWKNRNPNSDMPLPMIFGTGIMDIVPTAYELMPWSFFLDYFTNLGGVLDAWQMRFVEFAWLNETVRQEHEMIIRSPGNFHDTLNEVDYKCSMTATHVKRWDVSRAKIDSRFSPIILVKAPGLGDTKWLNIAALAQMLRP